MLFNRELIIPFSTKIQGRTPSDLTGPENAHRGDNYIYAEGSSPRQPGDVAILETDIIFPCKVFFTSIK